MKKILSLLLTILMLASFGVCAMAEETGSEDFLLAEKEMSFYMDDPEAVEQQTVYFPDDSDVPYLSLRDWADIMTRLFKIVSDDENYTYRLDFSIEDGVGILTREDGYSVSFDAEHDVISFLDYDAFLRPSTDRLLIDILSVDEPAPNEEAKYFHRSEGSYERYGKTVTLNLADYGIDLFSDGEDCYVPVQTLSDFMLAPYYRNIFYNGEAIFLSRFGGLGMAEHPSALGKLFYSVEARERSEAMAEFSYFELCLAMDHLYGLKERHGISSFDEHAEQTALKAELMSRDPFYADAALYELLNLHLDDLHSGFNSASPLDEEGAFDKLENMLGYGYSSRQSDYQDMTYMKARDNAYPDGVPAYEEIGNTAYITFDTFIGIPGDVDYYETAPTADEFDTIGILLYAYEQITREDSPIENVVLDLSCNGGGNADTAIFTIATLLGEASVSVSDTMTGALCNAVYKVDCNLDGKFDEDDLGLTKKNIICLTSPNSFSCGNLVPCALKSSNRATLMGRTSGGGSCVVLPLSTADGSAFQISGFLRLSYIKNGSFYDIDQGTEPDYPLMRPASFYDREALTEYINTLK